MNLIELSKKYKWNIPTVCPVCKSNLEINESGQVYCPNNTCPKKIEHSIMKMSNKWSVLEIGPRIIEDFVKEAKIKSLAQFFKDINNKKLDDICGKNAEKIRTNLKAAMLKPRGLANFISAFDIEDFGERRIQSLVDAGYNTIEKLLNAKANDLSAIKGWTLTSGEKIIKALDEIKNDIIEVSKLCNICEKEKTEGKLSGLSFCFTGAMSYKRSDLEKMVVDNGGTISSVNKTLSYLVQADPNSTSSKSEKAKKFGTKIISCDDFIEMLTNC